MIDEFLKLIGKRDVHRLHLSALSLLWQHMAIVAMAVFVKRLICSLERAIGPSSRVDSQSRSCRSRWHERIGDPTVADGILVHNAHRIEMRGIQYGRIAASPADAGPGMTLA
jgi:hypothetical protein